MKSNPRFLLWASILAYGVFASCSLDEPAVGDVVEFLKAQEEMLGIEDHPEIDLQEGLGIWHPLMYQAGLCLMGSICGTGALPARAFGGMCFIATVFLTYAIGRMLRGNSGMRNHGGSMACLLMVLTPLSIQGSLNIDIDTSVLCVMTTLFTWCSLRYLENPNHTRLAACSMVFCISLWAKLTTPWIFLFCVSCSIMFRYGARKAVEYFCIVVLVGAGFFLSTWIAVSYVLNIPWERPFAHLYRAFLSRTSGMDFSFLLQRARDLITMVFWFSPIIIAATLIVALKHVKAMIIFRRGTSIETISLIFICTFLAYIVLSPVVFSLPKYHFVILPLSGIILANALLNNGRLQYSWKLLIALAPLAILALVGALIFPDPLKALSMTLKVRILEEGTRVAVVETLKELLPTFAVYIVSLLIAIIVWKVWYSRTSLGAILLVWSLLVGTGGNIGLGIVQSRASYLTIYCYGTEGTEKLVQFLSGHLRFRDRVVSPETGIRLALGGSQFRYIGRAWRSAEQVLDVTRKSDASAIVYGVGTNTVSQYRDIFWTEKFREGVSDTFHRKRIGSYDVWLKVRE